MTENKSIFFLTLSFICIWLILDNIYGKKYIDRFLTAVFPFYKGDVTGTENTAVIQTTQTENTSDDKSDTKSDNTHGGIGGTY